MNRLLNEISYEALASRPYILSVKQIIVTKKLYGFLGFFVLCVLADYYLLPAENQGFVTKWSFIFVSLAIAVVVSTQYEEIIRSRWLLFAKNNEWESLPFAVVNLPPSLRNVGRRELTIRSLLPIVEGKSWMLTPYSYRYPDDRRGELYSVLILSYHLPKKLPYIAIDSRTNSGGLVNTPKGFEAIHLEGEFNKDFNVFVQRGLYADALSIVTPDIMAVLEDKFKNYDVEIVDDQLFIIAPVKGINEKAVREYFEAADTLANELLHRCKSLQYEAGKKFDFRGAYHRAITVKNANYQRSMFVEFLREPRWKKILAVLLVISFVALYVSYLFIDN